MQDLLSWISWADAFGYAGGIATVWSFNQTTMIPLRMMAIGGNVGLIIFGFMASSYPPLVLHVVLLPLNILRLLQAQKLIRDIREASKGDGNLSVLIPFMSEHKHKMGDILFRKGDEPLYMILIVEGIVRLEEITTNCGPGKILGEMAAFTPDNARTCTAVCETDVRLYRLSNDTMLQLFHQNPQFGMYLVRLIVCRLQNNWTEAERVLQGQAKVV